MALVQFTLENHFYVTVKLFKLYRVIKNISHKNNWKRNSGTQCVNSHQRKSSVIQLQSPFVTAHCLIKGEKSVNLSACRRVGFAT